MANDPGTVVFVGVPDLVKITGRTKARFSQLVGAMGQPNPVLPEGDAIINGLPTWRLDEIVARLDAAGLPIKVAEVTVLRRDRVVPARVVPVGIAEAAEALGVSSRTMKGRVEQGNTTDVLFWLGRNRVWDLNEIVTDAKSRGFEVNDAAVEKWHDRNGTTASPTVHKVVGYVRIEALVTTRGRDAAVDALSDCIQDLARLNAGLGSDRMTIVESAVESAEVTDSI